MSFVEAFVRQHFAKAKARGDGWEAKCPAHEDKRSSLSIAGGKNGCVLLNCFAGCDLDSIVSSLGITKSALFPTKTRPANGNGRAASFRIVARYIYRLKDGTPSFRIERREPKDFRAHQAYRGGWKSTKGDAIDVVYHLPDLQKHDVVTIVEGEKDVDRLWALDIPATCNAHGSGQWKQHHTEQLHAAGIRRVTLIPDNDKPGVEHMRQVAASLQAAGIDVRWLELTNVPRRATLAMRSIAD